MERLLRLALIRDLSFFFSAVLLAVLFWRHNILLACLLVIVYIGRQYFWSQKEDHVIYVWGAVLGCTAEIIAPHVGIWEYSRPTVLKILLWLPFAWGLAAVLVIQIAKTFVKET